MHTRFSNPLLALAAGSNLASMEARFLRWQMKNAKERDHYITSRKDHATSQNDDTSIEFWNEVETHLKTITEENNDQLVDLISLATHVDTFKPKEEWITPILQDTHCQDFRTQLLTAVEDYNTK